MNDTQPPDTPGFRDLLRRDLPASIVVFLVALPLCMGIALASGAPIMSGLVAGIIGGLVVGLLGGAPLLVSGPAAGLAVMVYGFIQELGFPVACAAVVGAGVLQMVFGRLGIARAALGISPAVIHGMLAGIGVLIVLSQLHVVLGATSHASALENVTALPAALAQVNVGALITGLGVLAILIAWPRLPLRRLRTLPAPLVAVLGMTAVAAVLATGAPRVELTESLFQSLSLPRLPDGELVVPFVIAALSLAFVASAESLLSAVATDRLHDGPRARLDRELFAQGAANSLSGLVGGLPITGVIVRSAANIAAGAKTRASATLHGVWLLVFVSMLGATLEWVPLAALAGLLVHVGFKLVQPAHIRELARRGELSVYLVTLGGVVFINLLAGILLGFALALLKLVWRLGRVHVRVLQEGGLYRVEVNGALTFLGVPRVTAALEKLPAGAHVKLCCELEALDHAGLETLETWASTHQRVGGRVEMEDLEALWRRLGAPTPAEAAAPSPSPQPGLTVRDTRSTA
ncbi:MAG TPA: SulP family inorganic anion transporter [Myxococcaceae bacterium]|nr:SulP family inorganic anion transporter [Myxococcaceae bacterium]